jgi:hypothetical protein
VRGSEVLAGELKSAEEIRNSVAGGTKQSTDIEGTFRGKIAAQHASSSRSSLQPSNNAGTS